MKNLINLTLVIMVVISAQIFANDWSSFAENNSNSSYTEDAAPTFLNNSVTLSTPNYNLKTASSPVVANGKVYAYASGSLTGALYCFNANTLVAEWHVPILVNDSGYDSWSSPAVSSNCIVFGAKSFLGCWELDGTERWTITLSNTIGNSSTTIANDKVIIGCFRWSTTKPRGVAAYDILTGSNLWFATDSAFSEFSACTPVIDKDAGKGYACNKKNIFQFNINTGNIDWNIVLPNANALQNVSMNNNTLFVSDFMFSSFSAGSNLYALSKTDGTIKWVAQVNVSDVPPAIKGNVLVHSAGDAWGVPQELVGIDVNTGTQLWKVTKSLGGWNFMPAISKGIVYASANNSTNLTAVNISDGSVISEIAVGGSSPAIANGTLYTIFNGALCSYSIPEPFCLLTIFIVLTILSRRNIYNKNLYKIILLIFLFSIKSSFAGPYPPAAGQSGSTAIYKTDSVLKSWATNVYNYSPGSNVDPRWQNITNALGPAEGTSTDICCLGRGGSITLEFNPPIADGPGNDFATFENSFNNTFLELGWVEVSIDGSTFYRFPNTSLTASPVGGFGAVDPTDITGYCSKYKQGWGTPFDLADLSVTLFNPIKYVRIVDIVGDGSCTDSNSNVIYDPYPTVGSSGVDLDAIGVINQAPEPAGWLLLSLLIPFIRKIK